jgi:aspartate kinase
MGSRKEIWVSKFGGTSLANARQIMKVKDIVFADERRKIVVVSAPGKEHKEDIKVTDLLLNCHTLVQKGKPIDEPFAIIRRRILEIAEALHVNAARMRRELDVMYDRLPRETSADYAGSRGEYLNALMIAEHFGATFIDAEDIVRLTKDGRVDEQTYGIARIALGSVEGRIVIPGFYGKGPDGKIKTFSRGGSDISGAIAARAVEADVYENWTDVSGIYIADPRVARNAGPVSHITYKEFRELATIGASVFHEDAIAPVRTVGIPINVKNTNDPDAPGTMITAEREVSRCHLVGVSGKKPYRKLVFDKFMLDRFPEVSASIHEAIAQKNLVSDLVVDAFDTIVAYIPTDMDDADAASLQASFAKDLDIDSCTISGQLVLLGIVGEGMALEQGLLARVSALLAKLGISGEVVGGPLPVKLLLAVPLQAYATVLNELVDLIVT